MNDTFLTRRRAVHAAHDRSARRGLVFGAAVLAAAALHLSLAASLMRSGTDGQHILARQAVATPRLVAHLGELPMITVVGRRNV